MLDQNGVETTGTAYASVPQSANVSKAYFLVYQVNSKPKYALAEIGGTAGNYTITINDTTSAYNNAKFSNNTEAFIPLTIDTSQGANNVSVTGVQGATTNRLIFDGSMPRLNNLTLDGSVYDVRLGDYLYITSGLVYAGTKESFKQNVTLSGDANQYFDVYDSTRENNYYSVAFYGTSVYYAEINQETGTGTFTRVDETISDANKLSGTVVGSYDETTGEISMTFTYLDDTSDTFRIVTEEFGGQYVELVEGE